MTPIRAEFEKAFNEAPASAWTPKAMALWAAKWIAERCAMEIEKHEKVWQEIEHQEKCSLQAFDHPEIIRQLAKELDGERV